MGSQGLAQDTQNIKSKEVEVGRVSLARIVKFFRLNWKFLVLLALVLSVIAVTLVALLLPRWQYQKQITLSVRPVPSELVGQIEQEYPGLNIDDMTPDQAGSMAVGYLSSADFGQIETDFIYRADAQQVQVNLQSENRDLLEGGLGPKAVDSVEAGYQRLYEGAIGAGLEAKLSRLERDLESNKQMTTQLEREIERLSTGGAQDVSTAARLEALETRRVELSTNIVWSENLYRDLQQAQDDLSLLATEPTGVEVLSESDVQRQLSRPFVALVVLAVVSSFVVAAIATVIRAAVGRGKKAFSR